MSFSDIVIECPHCRTRSMKENDRPEFYKGLDENLVTMGCHTCGHLAVFSRDFLEEYIQQLIRAGKYPTE